MHSFLIIGRVSRSRKAYETSFTDRKRDTVPWGNQMILTNLLRFSVREKYLLCLYFSSIFQQALSDTVRSWILFWIHMNISLCICVHIKTITFKHILDLALKNTTSFEELQKVFMDLLNKFAPLKCKYLRANHSKFMRKELSKAIMLRTRFRHQFLKMKTPEAKAKYNKQRNICVSLTRKAKRNYYESLDLNNICDNKK